MVWERFYGGVESSATFEMKDRDVRMDPLVAVQRPYCPPTHMDAEDSFCTQVDLLVTPRDLCTQLVDTPCMQK